jgi:putative effector of murein hydrolase LrgA (UPF0299 family)
MVSWFTIFILAIVFLFTVFLLLHYPSKKTPVFVYFLVFVGWSTSFSIVVLLPFDIFKANIDKNAGNFTIEVAWKVVYWTTFSLCWLFLPVAEKFHTSGEFTFVSKLRNAIYRQIRSFLMIIALGIALILYLYFVEHLNSNRMLGILVLMGNIWGLFLLVTLLGFGLVSIPISCWVQGSLSQTLQNLQLKSVPLDESCIDSKYRLNQCVAKVMRYSSRISQNSNLREYISIILSKCPEDSLNHPSSSQNSRQIDSNENRNLEYNDLVALHKELKDLISENLRSEW